MDIQQASFADVGVVLCVVVLVVTLALLPTDKVDIWLTQKLMRFLERRRAGRQEKDAANPGRVERRKNRKEFWGKATTCVMLLTGMLLLPIGSVPLAIWQRAVGNEAWALIIVAAMQGALGVWLLVIKTALQIRKEEQQGKPHSQS